MNTRSQRALKSTLIALVALVAGLVVASPVSAQSSTQCASGGSPEYTEGFGALSTGLGTIMGDPVTCPYPDPSGTGDVEQSTSTGLAFWRKSTNTPTFTNGARHWALTEDGWRSWAGSPIDPPANAAPFGPAANTPTPQQITQIMASTVEVGTPAEHFQPAGAPLTISDGMGGTVTAAAGQRVPTADAHGQLLFFWHDAAFVDWDADFESVNIINISSPSDGIFIVTYPTYMLSDALCCPSLPPTTVTYQWDGRAFRGTVPPPRAVGNRVHVRLVGG